MADVSRPQRRPRPVRTAGLVLLVAGLAVLAYVAWQMFGTNMVSRHRAEQITTDTRHAWREGSEPPALGLLRVPRFGKDFEVPIVKGFGADALAKGVGWYPEGARVGSVGNYVLAGHRVTHGEPFRKFPDLRKGDTVTIETRTATYTYRLRNAGQSITVDFDTAWPLWPVPAPGARDRAPTKPLITLLTCAELFHTDNRNVVVGDLVSTETKSG
jgi:sortase A